MTAIRAYLDHNATTPLRPEARAAMLAALDVVGNPSSIHAEGRAARDLVEAARQTVAAFLGGQTDDVVFTSGATEALNLVLSPEAYEGEPFQRLLLNDGEHAAVRAGHRFGAAVERVALHDDGRLDLDALAAALARPGRALVALQAANNETGVIQPVAEAAALTHAAGGILICDAVQAAGKIACDFNSLPADILIVSAHKFGGPKGVGALCVGGVSTHLKRALIRGGGQERGLRSGTENVAGIAGMAAAVEALSGAAGSDAAWRGRVEADVRRIAPEASVFGSAAGRLPNTVCFAIPGVEARLLTMSLDLEGVAVSAGSACASGKIEPSVGLLAMGVPADLARGAVRVSLGWSTSEADVAAFGAALARVMGRIGSRRAA